MPDLRLQSLALGRQRVKTTGGASFSEIFSSRVTRLRSEATSDTARSVLSFVPRGDEPMGFVFVSGFEGLLLAGDEVFAVEGAPGAEEYAVALFHVLFHVVNMNQLDPSPSASSGRGCLGLWPSFSATEESIET